MRKKVLIIYNGYSLIRQNKYKINRLIEELKKFNIDAKPISSLEIFCNTESLYSFLDGVLFAINLDKDFYLAKKLEEFIPVYNNSLATKNCDDKMTTILLLSKCGIKTPKTISSPLAYQPKIDKVLAKNFIDYVEEELTYPLVFKHCYGSLGKQVKLINNRKELEKVYFNSYLIPHIYEEFLSSHRGNDYRVIVIGSKVVAVMNRINEKDFRSNIYLGGKGFDVTNSISNKIKNLAIKASNELGLDYSGVDIMLDNNDEPTLLEVNSNPFFSEVEKVTKINITNYLIEYLLSK